MTTRRDARIRRGHSLLFMVGLAIIVFVAYLLATVPPSNDWSCPATSPQSAQDCRDIDY